LHGICEKRRISLFLLAAPLVLSAYTHLWNPVGFPDIFYDEGIYVRRAMNILDSGNPQEAYFYDHPFFGQIVLSGVLRMTGHPDSLGVSTEASSLETLYMVPRVFMGILAVLDTFLIYKIAEKRFRRRTAIVASILFAVMPMSWLLRRILLDSLFLPFALSSILLALYSRDSDRRHALMISSGVCLGLAIFTKIPAFAMVPLVSVLVYSASKKTKDVGLWSVPVILIPLIWPAYSLSVGQFDSWLNDVLWQAGRASGGLPVTAAYLLEIDSVLLTLGIAGFVFAAMKREKFVVLWFAPMLLFLATIGFVQYFHWIPLIPAMCIAAAVLIGRGIDRVARAAIRNYAMLGSVFAIGIFGLITTGMIISSDVSSSQFEALSFVLENVDEEVTVLASPVYSWILYDVYGKNALADYSSILHEPIKTEKVLLVADPHFIYDIDRGPELRDVYEGTYTVEEFRGTVGGIDTSKFPNGSYKFTREGDLIEIKRNW